MKRVNVYDDGKLSRAYPAILLREEDDRVLIKFEYEKDVDAVWYNAERLDDDGIGSAFSCYDEEDHWSSNYWYYPSRGTMSFGLEVCEYFTKEYFDEYFSYLLEKEDN